MSRWVRIGVIGYFLGMLIGLMIALTGCSSQPTLQPHLKPQATLTTTPRVDFMGDDQIAGLVAYAGNPLWTCSTCEQAELSTTVLTKVPQVIALHPDIVVVQTGAYDEGILTSRTQPTFGDILDIIDALEAAGIPVVVCSLPDSSAYDPYYLNFGLDDEYTAGIIPNLFTFNDAGQDLTAGIDYSQPGLAEVYPAFYQEVESFGLGGTK